ncbi:MAG TPA: YHS domain-containing protein [Anaerolineales bacterium]|jgi:YHS domain-containing protein|nr:YHS domain-containing protein [Anaerolineales bacterium]HNA87686.1 YHS domain-containing protein [Anaerolineales bacterium]HNB34663.1 YHS domain-containing protein [Anaerolineales bacterium]HNC07662.1 YHS domain-containing protein [Anaerolineales bacterium]HNJ11961.1 YHS domain-containing protein [Anaerolineales bacterium]
MTSPNPDLTASETPAADQPSIKPVTLMDLGEDAIGGYCDPLTGECYPVSEAENLQKENRMSTAIDPVCKMEVEIETAQYKSEHAGETYYFCSAGCQKSFEQDPHKYLPEDHHGHSHSHEGHSH